MFSSPSLHVVSSIKVLVLCPEEGWAPSLLRVFFNYIFVKEEYLGSSKLQQ